MAAACFAAVGVLGHLVSAQPPSRLDVESVTMRGHAVALAVFFTRLGRWYAISTITPIVAVLAILANLHDVAVIAVELFGAQVLAQGSVNALKSVFARTRPDDWLHRLERGFSYPSGHAATAIVYYVGLAVLVARTPGLVPALKLVCIVPLIACAFGLPWSRIALGAHYATDVLGGLIFGAGWLCICAAVTNWIGVPMP